MAFSFFRAMRWQEPLAEGSGEALHSRARSSCGVQTHPMAASLPAVPSTARLSLGPAAVVEYKEGEEERPTARMLI